MGLYEMLKGDRRGARQTPSGGSAIAGVVSRLCRFVLYLVLFPLAALVSYAWSLRGDGATFTVMARRVERRPQAAAAGAGAPISDVTLDEVPAPFPEKENV